MAITGYQTKKVLMTAMAVLLGGLPPALGTGVALSCAGRWASRLWAG